MTLGYWWSPTIAGRHPDQCCFTYFFFLAVFFLAAFFAFFLVAMGELLQVLVRETGLNALGTALASKKGRTLAGFSLTRTDRMAMRIHRTATKTASRGMQGERKRGYKEGEAESPGNRSCQTSLCCLSDFAIDPSFRFALSSCVCASPCQQVTFVPVITDTALYLEV